MNNKSVLITLVLLLCAGVGIAVFVFYQKHEVINGLSTYFSYEDDELTKVSTLSSKESITLNDILKADDIAYRLIEKNTQNPTFTEDTSKVYAYLAMAERDFAAISYSVSGTLSGNIDSLARQVLCLFFVQDCASIVVQSDADEYSKEIEKLVVSKVKARIAEDKLGLKNYELKTGKEYWDGPQPSTGRASGSSKGWFIERGDQFRSLPPPAFDSAEFKEQLVITKDRLKNATSEEKLATVFWAGAPGTKTPPGQILKLGTDYMVEKNIPLPKIIIVRSVLAGAVADANTAVFDGKYTYQVRRPFMMDHSISTIMPTPNHPSYPAGHSTLSTAGATVLVHFFPEDTAMWKAKAEEAGMSRIWGGIHYMMDHEAGKLLGEQIGVEAIKKVTWVDTK